MENQTQPSTLKDNLILGGALGGLIYGAYKIFKNYSSGGLSDIDYGNPQQRKAVMARLRESGEMTWTPGSKDIQKSKGGTPAKPKARKKRKSATNKKTSVPTKKPASKTTSKTTPKVSKPKRRSTSPATTKGKVNKAITTTNKISGETEKGFSEIKAILGSIKTSR